MQIISFFMSVVMAVTSLFLPVSTLEVADSASSRKAAFLSAESQEVLSVVIKNIVNEAKTGTSESEEVLEAINSLPIHENGEVRTDRESVDVSPITVAVCEKAKELINEMIPDGTINHFLNHLANGMYDLYVYLVPIEGSLYYIYCDYVDNYNDPEVVFTGIKYDMETGKLYGQDDNGLMGIGFDYDAKNYIITTPRKVWMRDMGYSILYDIVGGMGFMDTDTVRVKFEHGGKHWMFQFWKGNYGFGRLNGVELGIYNKTDKNAFSYNCATDEEMLDMSITLKNGEETLIEREEMRHWWMCGFRFGPGLDPEDLAMESTIQFEDEAMMNAFLEAAEEYSDEMEVTSDETMKVTIIWK
ncbi:MAG: DUF4474 domain-containing protein [Clostridia bacterium]|nr:DUF4474 domain-containing protein [Clostridia bacterium]